MLPFLLNGCYLADLPILAFPLNALLFGKFANAGIYTKCLNASCYLAILPILAFWLNGSRFSNSLDYTDNYISCFYPEISPTNDNPLVFLSST